MPAGFFSPGYSLMQPVCCHQAASAHSSPAGLCEHKAETPLLLRLLGSSFQDINCRSIWGVTAWQIWRWRKAFKESVPELCSSFLVFSALFQLCCMSLVWGGMELWQVVRWPYSGQPVTTAKSHFWVITFGVHEFMYHFRVVFCLQASCNIYLHQGLFANDLLPRHFPCKGFLQLFSWSFVV